MFSIEKVACGIGRTTIVQNINFRVEQGTMTALVGINGAGKSTLLRGIAGIAKLHAGKVLLDGVDVHAMRPRQRAQNMTLVGQEESPPGDLTIAEMVALGRLPHLKSWQLGGKAEQKIIHNALQLVGLDELADRSCDQLSGGQRRRALLARGFAQGTDLILLDEPTNHLDVHHQLHLLKVLRESGRTILATIHDLDLAVAHFDQVVVLHEGTMLAVGTPEEVLNTENLRKVFDVRALLANLPEATRTHLIIDSL
ncbi:ABC transporter ATP-binding protein [Corynebacterium freiburgense]|uniref:ABC transporter ATP-binding protein n=1 Tax=Corynebacterium freiburgense TaxID=556548 RepID=UPI0003FD355E|nr:ABC transporter ATP-binding protein [Corynebacterium freiburgense]WJZ02414.1 putative siderophore transport system ATP-binding protein YusV [Corynebacterium freiburgense]